LPQHKIVATGDVAVRAYQEAFGDGEVWATKFTLGALKGLMIENRKKGMVKIGFK
jgi:hypothetical protein